MDLDLGGRRVLITGGSGDIGRGLSRGFAAEGAAVALTYATQRSVADEVAAEIRQPERPACALHLDLHDRATVREAVRKAAASLGGLDVVVSNAVAWETESKEHVEDWSDDEWPPFLRANIDGVVTLVKEAAPYLRTSGVGRIVFVSSSLTDRGMAGVWCYTTTKSAGHGLAKSMMWDLGRDGVLVNTVAPGIVLNEHGTHRNIPDDELVELGAKQPLGRLPTVDDVVRLVLFLSSPANRSINGEVVRITGGVA